jgi:hypothetical protein
MDPRTDALETGRREFLLALGKWSTVVIGAVAGAGLLHSATEGGWVNTRGGWINGAGGWINARTGGTGWVNGGGGGWINNRGGGGWLNGR